MAATAPLSVSICPVLFVKKKACGDFEWMVKQPEYDDALFIVMENFIDSMSDECSAGAGTAVLRPLTLAHFRSRGAPRPRAFGIPTGWCTDSAGFSHMDCGNIKAVIDLSLDRAALLLRKGAKVYKRIIFSCSEDDRSLIGTGVFKKTLGKDVIEYISKGIAELPTRVIAHTTFKQIRLQELKIMPFALLVEGYCRLRGEIRRLKEENEKLKETLKKRPSTSFVGDVMPQPKQMRISFNNGRLY